MSFKGVPFQFTATPWQHSGAGGWVFVALPEKMAKEIRTLFRDQEQGWGRLTATAKIGDTEWKSAIWFDTKRNTYLLPLKANVRKLENIDMTKKLKVMVWV